MIQLNNTAEDKHSRRSKVKTVTCNIYRRVLTTNPLVKCFSSIQKVRISVILISWKGQVPGLHLLPVLEHILWSITAVQITLSASEKTSEIYLTDMNWMLNEYYSHRVVFTSLATAQPSPVRSNTNDDKVNECQGSDKTCGENSTIIQLSIMFKFV